MCDWSVTFTHTNMSNREQGQGYWPCLQNNRVRKWLWIHKLLLKALRPKVGNACVVATSSTSPPSVLQA